MNYEYMTDRLVLKILDASYAQNALQFFTENRDIFEPFEPSKPENFYTYNYQRSLMTCEYQMALKLNFIRFWVFLKEDPDTVIGTVSYQNFFKTPYQKCQTGYRFDRRYWHNGYATEALDFANRIIFRELSIHRIEAYVMPENQLSIRLLERLNFIREGFCRSCINICGRWTDHYLYALLSEDINSLHQ
ncbi:MAG: GNAT family N-acetyltransferase [Eubacterium sp.]|jgi:ribosomal-protein-alanine N-acetyltransferase|nr:GNAT family N-acetyltransferase [Eubacterium sp.]